MPPNIARRIRGWEEVDVDLRGIGGRGLAAVASTVVFGLRARVARLRLGAEEIELIDFLAPEGRPIPADSRSNDEWFQHIAIIVRDMDEDWSAFTIEPVELTQSGDVVME